MQPHATLLRGPGLRLSAAACRTLSRPPCGAPSAALRSARGQPNAALLAQPLHPSPAPGYAAACRTPARPQTAPLRSPMESPCSVTERVPAQPHAAPPVQPMRPSPAPHAAPLLSQALRPGPGEAPSCAPAKPHTATLRSRSAPAQSQAAPLCSGPVPHPCALPSCAHAHPHAAPPPSQEKTTAAQVHPHRPTLTERGPPPPLKPASVSPLWRGVLPRAARFDPT